MALEGFNMLTKLNLPVAPLKLINSRGQLKVHCIIRNSSVVLTPEEWVRQHVLNYLITHAGYPKGSIAVEYSLKYNGRQKRCDILVTDFQGAPFCIVECKAPEVSLNDTTFHQIAAYDFTLQAKILVVSNGLNHFSMLKTGVNDELTMDQKILSWEELLTLFPT